MLKRNDAFQGRNHISRCVYHSLLKGEKALIIIQKSNGIERESERQAAERSEQNKIKVKKKAAQTMAYVLRRDIHEIPLRKNWTDDYVAYCGRYTYTYNLRKL